MSITHSGSMAFYEERDRSVLGFPNLSPMQFLKDCDWDTTRNDLAFQSLAGGVCFAIALNDKNSLRTFKLEKLSYGYRGSDNVVRAIDHEYLYEDSASTPMSDLMEYQRWDNARNMLVIRLKILNLGQVDRLQYQAQIRLCQLEVPYVAGSCKVVKLGEAGADAADLATRLR